MQPHFLYACSLFQVLSETVERWNYMQDLAQAHRGSSRSANSRLTHQRSRCQMWPPRPPSFTSPLFPLATLLLSQTQGSLEQVFTSYNWGLFLKILHLLAQRTLPQEGFNFNTVLICPIQPRFWDNRYFVPTLLHQLRTQQTQRLTHSAKDNIPDLSKHDDSHSPGIKECIHNI